MKTGFVSAMYSVLLLTVLAWMPHLSAQLVDPTLPIEVEADATGADARTGKVTFTNIAIRQGPLAIRANSAESSTLDFDDSTWTFRGSVNLSAPGSQLNADRMTLRFVNKRIQQATLTGSPLSYTGSAESGTDVTARSATVLFSSSAIASVELKGDPIEMSRAASANDKRMEGRANSMTYSASTDNLELTGDAQLGEGANLITGNQITYNLTTRQVLAAANELGEGKVHITINPSSDDAQTDPDDSGDPASGDIGTEEQEAPRESTDPSSDE